MAAKKSATGDAKKTTPKRAAKKVAKVKALPTYKTLGALKAAKKKGTAPRSILTAIVDGNIVFSVKDTVILTLNTADFVINTLKADGFKSAATAAS